MPALTGAHTARSGIDTPRGIIMSCRMLFAVLAMLALRGAASASHEIDSKEFGTLHAMIRPHAGEAKWSEIPWLTDLLEARKKAAAEGKPILIWSASGEPFGCT